MKTLNKLLMVTLVLLVISCGTTVKFPVSRIVPAAEIKASIKQDKNKNNTIEITANHLASPDRLKPPKTTYVAWVVTEDNGVKNIGQLANQNAEKATLKSTTPFKVKEIFITAENQGNVSYPGGVEISRTRVSVK